MDDDAAAVRQHPDELAGGRPVVRLILCVAGSAGGVAAPLAGAGSRVNQPFHVPDAPARLAQFIFEMIRDGVDLALGLRRGKDEKIRDARDGPQVED